MTVFNTSWHVLSVFPLHGWGRWFESNRAYQTKFALLGGLEEVIREGNLFFVVLNFMQNVHKISGSFTRGNVNV